MTKEPTAGDGSCRIVDQPDPAQNLVLADRRPRRLNQRCLHVKDRAITTVEVYIFGEKQRFSNWTPRPEPYSAVDAASVAENATSEAMAFRCGLFRIALLRPTFGLRRVLHYVAAVLMNLRPHGANLRGTPTAVHHVGLTSEEIMMLNQFITHAITIHGLLAATLLLSAATTANAQSALNSEVSGYDAIPIGDVSVTDLAASEANRQALQLPPQNVAGGRATEASPARRQSDLQTEPADAPRSAALGGA